MNLKIVLYNLMSSQRNDDDVPLGIVKYRLNNKHIIQMIDELNKKSIHRQCIEVKLNKEVNVLKRRRVMIDENSDRVCAKCEYKPNYHPDGCN